MKLVIDENAFVKISEDESLMVKADSKKFNLRIHKNDLKVLDALAKKNNVSRSHLLNLILEKILIKSVAALDTRAGYFVATTANQLAGISKEQGWLLDIANVSANSALDSYLHQYDWEESCSEEPTERDYIYSLISQAIKDGKLGKI